MPAANQTARKDRRIHSAVYHKRDSRVNDIIRRCRKSEIINLFNIDCCMLFRVEQAHVQFDMLQNNRPYLLFDGKAEGVFLPEKMGLLFPNSCDQLDFLEDRPVDAAVTYALSDLEIATLANNGLFNNDWSCQGRVLGSVLEIPCKIDYYAVANTPITFIEIQDRLSLHTSTMLTGYKSLVAAFLPYQAQKHNEERRGEIREVPKFDMTGAEIRKRGLYDTKAVGFDADPSTRSMAGGASFVEVAQARIKARLQKQMEKGNVLGTGPSDPKQVADHVTKTVEEIKGQAEGARKRAENEALDIGTQTPPATLDARLNDMVQRMVYAGGQAIPVQVPPVAEQPLVPPKQVDQNDSVMTTPTTKVSDIRTAAAVTADTVAEAAAAEKAVSGSGADDARTRIEKLDSKVHDGADAAKAVAGDIGKALTTRKDRLAARRAAKEAAMRQQSEAIAAAAKDEESKGLRSREPDAVTEVRDESTGQTQSAPKQGAEKKNLDGDILSGDGVDIDALIKELGL